MRVVSQCLAIAKFGLRCCAALPAKLAVWGNEINGRAAKRLGEFKEANDRWVAKALLQPADVLLRKA